MSDEQQVPERIWLMKHVVASLGANDFVVPPELREHAYEFALVSPVAKAPQHPKIVCLCGSTRFYKEFQRANYEETMAGHIVLSVGFYMHASSDAHGETWGCTSEQKIALDALHFRKIELADEVLVINVDGYIGESTRNEINHAKSLGKQIRFLEQG